MSGYFNPYQNPYASAWGQYQNAYMPPQQYAAQGAAAFGAGLPTSWGGGQVATHPLSVDTTQGGAQAPAPTTGAAGGWTDLDPEWGFGQGRVGAAGRAGPNGLVLPVNYDPSRDTFRNDFSGHEGIESNYARVMRWTNDQLRFHPTADRNAVLAYQLRRLKGQSAGNAQDGNTGFDLSGIQAANPSEDGTMAGLLEPTGRGHEMRVKQGGGLSTSAWDAYRANEAAKYAGGAQPGQGVTHTSVQELTNPQLARQDAGQALLAQGGGQDTRGGMDDPYRIGAAQGLTYDPQAMQQWVERANQGDPAAFQLLRQVGMVGPDEQLKPLEQWAKERQLTAWAAHTAAPGRKPGGGGGVPPAAAPAHGGVPVADVPGGGGRVPSNTGVNAAAPPGTSPTGTDRGLYMGQNPQALEQYFLQQKGVAPNAHGGFSDWMRQQMVPLMRAWMSTQGAGGPGGADTAGFDPMALAGQFAGRMAGPNFLGGIASDAKNFMGTPGFGDIMHGQALGNPDQAENFLQTYLKLATANQNPLMGITRKSQLQDQLANYWNQQQQQPGSVDNFWDFIQKSPIMQYMR